MNPKRIIIISGGQECDLTWIKSNDFVIACDKGFDYAKHQKIDVNCVIGDFDSTHSLSIDKEKIVYPSEKDDTDTMLAIKWAMSQGFSEIVLTCALGNRFDHQLANIQSCVYAKQRHISISIIDDNTEMVFLSDEEGSFKRKDFDFFSIFSLADQSHIHFLSGGKYELNDTILTNTFPLGVSNQWEKDSIHLKVGKGIVCCVLTKEINYEKN